MLGQIEAVLSDTTKDSSAGGNHVNWKITEANIQEHESIIMIGHSGGGVAVIDAYNSMASEYQAKVTQVVAIGSLQMPVYSGKDKTTIIIDPNDAIPMFGTSPGVNKAQYSYTVDNKAKRIKILVFNTQTALLNAALYVKYAAVDVHTSYFNTSSKAANILNKFWDRAVKQ